MLIVCPSCATSYTIDPAAVGPTGRTVRCARCKVTWFAGGPPMPAPEVSTFVDRVIAEVERKAAPEPRPMTSPAPTAPQTAAPEDFGSEEPESVPPVSPPAKIRTPEPAIIADTPSLVPPIEHKLLEQDFEEIESFAIRRQRPQARRKQTRRSSRWTAIILVLLAFNVTLVGARNEVVRYLPQTASLFAAFGLPVSLRNLKFENVRISNEMQDGDSVLIVDGVIVSEASKPVEVPRLRFAARNATGQEVYTSSALPSRGVLGPGERLEFRNQMPMPADATNVIVRFFTAHDSGAK
jgi:predicted Zn finger-like uncharacterized protein